MKTAELTGAALDWAVAKCEGEKFRWQPEYDCIGQEYDAHHYSTDWAQGGPIIELGRICIDIGHDGVWLAYTKQNYEDDKEFMHAGPTPLIAAMRCFVASRLGDEVDVPKELT